MTYTVAAVLGVLAAVALDLAVLRTRLVTRAVFWVAYAIVLFFQLVSNGVLTYRGVFRYHPDAILGLRVLYQPVEDLLFGFALVLTTLAVWTRLGGRRARRAAPRQAAPPAASSAPRDPDRTGARET